MPTKHRVLVVDDELSMRELLEIVLQNAGHDVTLAASVDRLWCVQTRQARRCSSPSPRLTGVAWTAANIAGTGLALSRGLHNSPQTPMIQIIGSPDFPDLVRPLASRLEFCAVSSYNMAGFSYLTP